MPKRKATKKVTARQRARRRASIRRRLLGICLSAAVCGILCLVIMVQSRSDADGVNPADIAAARSRGIELALKANELPPGTMEREEALLRIRSLESEIRFAGFAAAADAFAAAVDETLR